MEFLMEYGVADHIYIPIVKRAVVDFAVSADWTPAAGDVKISKDGGAAANVTNLPSAITMGNTAMWDFSITATELQAKKIVVMVSDSATKAVEDQAFIIHTYGNASAQHKANLNDSVRLGLTALPNAAAEAAGGLYTRGSGAGQINQNSNGQVDTRWVAGNVTVGTNSDKTGYTLSAAGVQAVWDALLSALTTGGSVGKKLADLVLGSDNKVILSNNAHPGAVIPTVTTLTGHTPQTGDNFARLGAPAGVSVSADIAAAKAQINSIDGRIPAALVGGRMDSNVQAIANAIITAAKFATDAIDSNAIAASGANKVRDAVWAQAMTELASVPGVTDSVLKALEWIFLLSRNKITQTATEQKLRDDADGADIGTATVADDGTTFTRGKFA